VRSRGIRRTVGSTIVIGTVGVPATAGIFRAIDLLVTTVTILEDLAITASFVTHGAIGAGIGDALAAGHCTGFAGRAGTTFTTASIAAALFVAAFGCTAGAVEAGGAFFAGVTDAAASIGRADVCTVANRCAVWTDTAMRPARVG